MFLQSYQNKSINEIIHTIRNGVGLFSQAQLYGLLLKREGLEMEVNGFTSKFMKKAITFVFDRIMFLVTSTFLITLTI